MRRISTAIIAVLMLAGAIERDASAVVASRLFIDGDETYAMRAGEPSEWIFEIYDPASIEPFHHFHPMHGKEVHAFVVSEDLSSFAHFHPTERGNHLGLFGIDVNRPNNDPDSQDAARAVMGGGRHFVFTESMPMQERMTILGHDIEATGPQRPSQPVVATPTDSEGISTILHEDYKVNVWQESVPHPGTYIVLIHAHLERFDPATGEFKPVLDLEPWLLSYAHAVMVSVDGERAAQKKVLHLHSAWPIVGDPGSGSGPDIDLAADAHTPPREGTYKTWLQFKHGGRIHSVPMAFEVKEPVEDLDLRSRPH